MLKALVDGKRAEDHEKQEEIVDAEGFFDQVAGEKLESGLTARIVQNAKAEQRGNRDPGCAGYSGFLQTDFVQTAAEYPQIERDRSQYKNVKGDPEERCSHRGGALFSRLGGIRGVQVGQLDS